jgi:hypothetical protein
MPSVFLLIILIFLYAPDFHVFLIGLLTKINREVSIQVYYIFIENKKILHRSWNG